MENFIFSAAYTHIMKRTITKIEQIPLFPFKIGSQESSVPVEDDLLEEEASEEVDDEIAATSSQVQVIPNQEVSRVSKHFKNKLARYWTSFLQLKLFVLESKTKNCVKLPIEKLG